MQLYDVIVIGGGHAGCEAASASARLGANTLLITKKFSNLGELSCNPAIGGVAKGTLVREIDALGGVMGQAIDRAGINFRTLNASKGPAVWGPRAQADRKLYREAVFDIMHNIKNLTIIEDSAEDIIMEESPIVKTKLSEYRCKSVVLTTGTFLNGLIHIGNDKTPAGRIGEPPTLNISDRLKSLGLNLARLKTGTPARLDGKTINWSILDIQPGDDVARPFSYLNNKITVPQIDCYITKTNSKTHDIINENIGLSAMYSGQIEGVGPRYCPSIEDKVVRFAHNPSHQIFLEPEGLDDDTVYPNGISTSLPAEVQDKFIRTIKGLEDVIILAAGYAIEYDYVDARQLYPSLEVKSVPNLFLAGQINGTTGYEEAGGQGLIAGLNAVLKHREQEFVLDRSQAYIGVMIDDLVRLGTNEPYRMFTSRSEYRLTLRADNADFRLTPLAIELGIVSEDRVNKFNIKYDLVCELKEDLSEKKIGISEANELNIKLNRDGKKRSLFDVLSYKDVSFTTIANLVDKDYPADVIEQVEIQAIYHNYLERQSTDIKDFKQSEALKIPSNFDYHNPSLSMSNESREKLARLKPTTLGAASRISGITQSAIVSIMLALKA